MDTTNQKKESLTYDGKDLMWQKPAIGWDHTTLNMLKGKSCLIYGMSSTLGNILCRMTNVIVAMK